MRIVTVQIPVDVAEYEDYTLQETDEMCALLAHAMLAGHTDLPSEGVTITCGSVTRKLEDDGDL